MNQFSDEWRSTRRNSDRGQRGRGSKRPPRAAQRYATGNEANSIPNNHDAENPQPDDRTSFYDQTYTHFPNSPFRTPQIPENFETKKDTVSLNTTNFRITGRLFFVFRFLHPLARISFIPEAVETPELLVLGFLVPIFGQIAMSQEYKFIPFILVGLLDLIHWMLAAIPRYYRAYWKLTESIYSYFLNLLAIGSILSTILFILMYGRIIVGESFRPRKPCLPKAKWVPWWFKLISEEEGKKKNERIETEKKRRRSSRSTENAYHTATECEESSSRPYHDHESSRSYSSTNGHGDAYEPHVPRPPPMSGSSPIKKQEPEIIEETEAQKIIKQLREELLGIGSISQRKARLRALQKQYHPDKNPPEEEEKVREVFHYVQHWWDDVAGNFGSEFRIQKDLDP